MANHLGALPSSGGGGTPILLNECALPLFHFLCFSYLFSVFFAHCWPPLSLNCISLAHDFCSWITTDVIWLKLVAPTKMAQYKLMIIDAEKCNDFQYSLEFLMTPPPPSFFYTENIFFLHLVIQVMWSLNYQFSVHPIFKRDEKPILWSIVSIILHVNFCPVLLIIFLNIQIVSKHRWEGRSREDVSLCFHANGYRHAQSARLLPYPRHREHGRAWPPQHFCTWRNTSTIRNSSGRYYRLPSRYLYTSIGPYLVKNGFAKEVALEVKSIHGLTYFLFPMEWNDM